MKPRPSVVAAGSTNSAFAMWVAWRGEAWRGSSPAGSLQGWARRLNPSGLSLPSCQPAQRHQPAETPGPGPVPGPGQRANFMDSSGDGCRPVPQGCSCLRGPWVRESPSHGRVGYGAAAAFMALAAADMRREMAAALVEMGRQRRFTRTLIRSLHGQAGEDRGSIVAHAHSSAKRVGGWCGGRDQGHCLGKKGVCGPIRRQRQRHRKRAYAVSADQKDGVGVCGVGGSARTCAAIGAGTSLGDVWG